MSKQQELISKRTDKELIRDWKVLDTQKVTPEIAVVRGWLMDEIEKRFPEAFDKWLENCEKNNNIEDYIMVF